MPRNIKYESFAALLNDVELLSAGYETSGQWTLGQACEHLARSLDAARNGYGMADWPQWKQFFTCRIVLPAVLGLRRMPSGVAAPESLQPAADTATDAGIAHLRQAIRAFEETREPLYPHPVFGAIPKPMLTRLQLVHAAHHFGRFVSRNAA